MKISINWVREFCPFKTRKPPREIGSAFSLATAEVEGVEERGAELERVVAARILEVRPHPRADGLRLARIDPGAGGEREVVCGAPNARAGLSAPFAAPGVVVGGREVRVADIRGVESPGTLLSEAELGVADEAGGLWELPGDAAPGTAVAKLFPGLRDTVLEIDNKSLTHRPDLWGHYGIAREFSVIFKSPLAPYPVRDELASRPGDPGIRVEIDPEPTPDAPPRCARYCGLRIDGVRVGRSPDWLRHRLFALGVRPISNVVDVTNLVMLELGQPLHAFDAARIRGGLIRVRRAESGETLRLLDGSEARLGPEDLVIADAAGAVALAGVMGGERSGISEATASVFLESASFAAAGVRRTALRTVRTDSSARFEKSLDPANARLGILRAAALILDVCPGARATGHLIDCGFKPGPPMVIEVSPRAISSRLGTPVGPRRVREILSGLGFGVREGPEGARAAVWRVEVPSWRATKDISIPEDLVEEVGRIHGYGRIAPGPPLWPVAAPPPNEDRLLERLAKSFLTLHGGLVEVFTYSMVGAAHCRAFGLDPAACIALKNPTSEDLDRLRREIVPIHLEKAAGNRRFFPRFGFFELGRVYLKDPERKLEPGLPRENRRIAGILAFERKAEENFLEVRHLALALLGRLCSPPPPREGRATAGSWELAPLPADRAWIHPSAGARVLGGGAELGRFYRVHPDVEARLELPADTLAFDLDFDAIAALPRPEARYRRLPRFPFVTFDIAVEVPERTPAGEIDAAIQSGAGPALRALSPFDVYRGPNLPAGMKSVAFQVAVGAEDRTLSAAEAEALRAGVIEALRKAGFKLRA